MLVHYLGLVVSVDWTHVIISLLINGRVGKISIFYSFVHVILSSLLHCCSASSALYHMWHLGRDLKGAAIYSGEKMNSVLYCGGSDPSIACVSWPE